MRTLLTAFILIPLLACGGTVEPDFHLWVVEVPDSGIPEGVWIVPTNEAERPSWPWKKGGTLCTGYASEIIPKYWVFWWDYIDPDPDDDIPGMGERHELTPTRVPEEDAVCEWPERPENNNG